ncbi:MAG: ParA family protein [Lachnospiraceae bacterium]|nr:ParA family protein [Lachnospiraceae bacterium]
MKTKVISFTNNKGGSGKTTTCSNVAYCLMERGSKVLVIDGDMQMNLSLSFLSEESVMEHDSSKDNIYHMLSGDRKISDIIVPSFAEGLDVIPSSVRLSEVEELLYSKGGKKDILSGCIKSLIKRGEYDYILIDVPPTLGLWVKNILHITDHVIIPVEASPWGLFGLANMVSYINQEKKSNKGLDILGIVLTKVNTRKNYYKDTKDYLSSIDEIRVFESIIRTDSTIEWAQDNSRPVTAYRKSARSAGEYEALTDEIIESM